MMISNEFNNRVKIVNTSGNFGNYLGWNLLIGWLAANNSSLPCMLKIQLPFAIAIPSATTSFNGSFQLLVL